MQCSLLFVWCSVVQRSVFSYVVQCSAVQYSTIQCSTLQHNKVLYSTAQQSEVQYSTTKCSKVQHNKVKYSTAQQSAVQYSTTKWSTVQHSTVQYITVNAWFWRLDAGYLSSLSFFPAHSTAVQWCDGRVYVTWLYSIHWRYTPTVQCSAMQYSAL